MRSQFDQPGLNKMQFRDPEEPLMKMIHLEHDTFSFAFLARAKQFVLIGSSFVSVLCELSEMV